MDKSNLDNLMDIREVLEAVEAEHHKKPEDKIRSFVEKIKNPYEFKVGSIVVRTSFAGKMTMDDCFANYLSAI